jgi:central kinetochore subunit Mis15/CHL4
MAPVLVKSLNRLSKETIIDLALQWLQGNHSSAPYLLSNRTGFEADEEDYLYTPAESIEKLRRLYKDLGRASAKETKRDVIDRIIDGDWRRGLSLHQHATLDLAYLEQNDTALRWSALKAVPLETQSQNSSKDEDSQPKKRRKLNHDPEPTYPDTSPEVFLAALKAEISPLVKAHYHLHRMPPSYNLTILRLYISPYSAFAPGRSKIPRRTRHAVDNGRILYIALPDSCPYVYISVSGSSSNSDGRSKGRIRDAKNKAMAKVDMAAMKRIILEAIPKALSRPQQRWALESTKLVARSLKTMCELRGNQKPGTGGGAYSVFADARERSADTSPVDVQMAVEDDTKAQHEDRQQLIERRFGHMQGDHYAALDRVHVKLSNVCPPADPSEGDDSRISVENEASGEIFLTFAGSDVFGGLKKLAHLGPGHVDLDRTPAWMMGELGVSSLTA